jgi:hypothetical protein
MNTEQSARLSVTLLTNRFAVPRWQMETLRGLEESGSIQVVSIASVDDHRPALERFCCALQDAVEARTGYAAGLLSARIDARLAFKAARALRLKTRPESGLAPARADADLVINCGVDPAFSRQLLGTRGTLTCDFGGAAGDTGLFRAMVRADRSFCLRIHLSTGERSVSLHTAWPALPERPILGEARSTVCRRAGALLAKTVRELCANHVGADVSVGEGMHASRPLDAMSMWTYGCRGGQRVLRGMMRRLVPGQRRRGSDNNWFLAYRTNPEHFVRNSQRFQADGYKLVLPPPGRFYADPCVIEHKGQDHVFLEEWLQHADKGVISCMRREGDRLTSPVQVLEQPYHLSYPFVFRSGTDLFMVPESAEARRVELYKAGDFPHRWEKVEELLHNTSAADPTLLRLDGRWWMFLNVGEGDSSRCDQLCLFYADKPYGPWKPHRQNPVKIDVRSSRSAGGLFRRGAKLMRPSQDCSSSYGGALTLCEVTRLSTREYAEVEVEKLLPSWLPSNRCFHTLSSSRGLEVIDGRMAAGAKSRFPAVEARFCAEIAASA